MGTRPYAPSGFRREAPRGFAILRETIRLHVLNNIKFIGGVMNDVILQLGIAGIILAVIVIVVSITFAKERRPLWALRSNTLQGATHPALEIRFGSSKIPTLFSERFVLWNAGRKVIREDDIPSNQTGPRLQFSSETEILHYDATSTRGDKSARLIPENTNALTIHFDYLKKGDAIFGDILCTTKSNSQPNIRMLGTFKGYPLRAGGIHNYSRAEQSFFFVEAIVLFFFTSFLAKMAYLALVADHIPSGIILSLITLFALGLTIIDLKFNVLLIPKKLPIKLKRYLKNGILQ